MVILNILILTTFFTFISALKSQCSTWLNRDFPNIKPNPNLNCFRYVCDEIARCPKYPDAICCSIGSCQGPYWYINGKNIKC